MSANMRTLGLDRLGIAERILLVEELWDSIAASGEAATLSEAHRQDLQRRLDACRDHPRSGDTWEVVKARLRDAPG